MHPWEFNVNNEDALETLNEQKSNASVRLERDHWNGLEPLNDQKSNASMQVI